MRRYWKYNVRGYDGVLCRKVGRRESHVEWRCVDFVDQVSQVEDDCLRISEKREVGRHILCSLELAEAYGVGGLDVA